jgi:SPP1 gp7 family putative phage head morphogenesis protein
MQSSLVFWITAAWRASGLAEDATPTQDLLKAFLKLSRRWQKAFDVLGDTLSKRFAERVLAASDGSLHSSLRVRGMTVKFTMTEDMRIAYQAVQAEQVGLIRSIASEHLVEVQGLVMRSVARGRDLGYLTDQLKVRYGITQRRAATIARDQNNKATSVLQATRQQGLGFVEGIWRHSHAGKVPRPSHVAANGVRFRLDKGLYLDGKWVMPGEEINCRCGWQPVIPGID